MTPTQGLSTAQAQQRLIAEGYNTLPSEDRRSLLRMCWDAAQEPMFVLLLTAGLLYLALGASEQLSVLCDQPVSGGLLRCFFGP